MGNIYRTNNYNKMKSYNDLIREIRESIEPLDEVLSASDPVEKWIHDFHKSKNPKFAGKTKEQITKMALGAYYRAQKK